MKPPHNRHGGPGRPPADRGASTGPRGAGARPPGSFRAGPSDRSDQRGAPAQGPARDGAPRAARPDGTSWQERPRHGAGKPPPAGGPGRHGRDDTRAPGRSGGPSRFAPAATGPDRRRPAGAPPDRTDQRDRAPPRHDEPRHDAPPPADRAHPRGAHRSFGAAPSGPPPAPAGTVWLYGHHAVAAALANPSRRLRRLLLTEEGESALASLCPHPWPLVAERTERARIDHLLGREAVHQGMALLADPLAPPSLAQMLERPGPVLVLDQVTDPRNVGAILRSAAAFGAAGVITQERNAPEQTGSLAKAASGALETVPLLRAVNIARTLIALKAADRWVVGLDAAGPEALSGPAFAGRRVALVLGAEGSGLRRLTRETCDVLAGLATEGAMASLNVAAAAAVALYEMTRRP